MEAMKAIAYYDENNEISAVESAKDCKEMAEGEGEDVANTFEFGMLVRDIVTEYCYRDDRDCTNEEMDALYDPVIAALLEKIG